MIGPVPHQTQGRFVEQAVERRYQLAEALTAAGKEFTFRTFEGAGHAFFSVDRPSYRPESAVEGWTDIFNFLARTLA